MNLLSLYLINTIFMRNLLFLCNSHILCGSLEGDPLFFKEYFSTLSGVIAIGGMMRAAGGGSMKCKEP
jgi:hypothetical protein